MKYLLALFALTLAPAAAQAGTELHCRQINPGIDHAYSAIVRNLSQAQISESTLAGPRILARVPCHRVPNPPRMPDRPYTLTKCEGNRFFGYALTVQTGGFTGRTTARLEQLSFRGGTRFLANLICR